MSDDVLDRVFRQQAAANKVLSSREVADLLATFFSRCQGCIRWRMMLPWTAVQFVFRGPDEKRVASPRKS